MGEFRGLSRLVSTDIGPHTLPQQSIATHTEVWTAGPLLTDRGP